MESYIWVLHGVMKMEKDIISPREDYRPHYETKAQLICFSLQSGRVNSTQWTPYSVNMQQHIKIPKQNHFSLDDNVLSISVNEQTSTSLSNPFHLIKYFLLGENSLSGEFHLVSHYPGEEKDYMWVGLFGSKARQMEKIVKSLATDCNERHIYSRRALLV